MGKTYTGIDIGTNSMKIAVSDGETIKTLAVETLPEGLVADNRIVSLDAMADFIKGIVARTRGVVKDGALVIPKADSLTRRLHVPNMTEHELRLNLPYEFRDYIPQGKEKYYYDYAVLSDPSAASNVSKGMDILAVATRKQTIADYQAMFKRAGLKLRIAMPVVSALQNLIGRSRLAQSNCCIIDFSYTAVRMHFFANGGYDVSRVIDIGGTDIDDAFARVHGVDVYMASELKRSSSGDAQVDEVVRDVYESIAVEIGRALNFYNFDNPEMMMDVAYLCGGGSTINALTQAVSSQVDIELEDIATIMPPAQSNDDLRRRCPAAVGVTMG